MYLLLKSVLYDTPGISDWFPLTGSSRGYFQCTLCGDQILSKDIKRHEQIARHKARMKQRPSEPGPTASASGSQLATAHTVLVDVLDETISSESFGSAFNNEQPERASGAIDINWDAFSPESTSLRTSHDAFSANLSQRLRAYLSFEQDIGALSDEDDGDVPVITTGHGITTEPDGRPSCAAPRHRRRLGDDNTPWFPWPDKEVCPLCWQSDQRALTSLIQTCVLDVLRHLPRCAFSVKQNAAIHWAMLALGVPDLPSDYDIDRTSKALQQLLGVQSIRYQGAMGHVYYVNDLAQLIAQVFRMHETTAY